MPSSQPNDPSYKLSREIKFHSADVRAVASFPSHSLIATASRDNVVALWKLNPIDSPNPMNLLHVLQGHSHFVNALAFVQIRNQKVLLISASKDKSIRLWDVDTGSNVATGTGHTDSVCSIKVTRFATDPAFVSASWDKSARVWTIAENHGVISLTCTATLTGHAAAVWDTLPLEQHIITASADKSIKVWTPDAACVATLQEHSDVVRSLAPTTDGGFVSVSNDGSAIVWSKTDSLARFKLLHRTLALHDGNFIYSVDSSASVHASSSSSSPFLVSSAGEDNNMRISRLQETSLQCLQSIPHPGTVWCSVFLHNGDIITGCSDTVARIFTSDPSRVASDEVLQSYQQALSSQKFSTQVIGGVDLTKLPDVTQGLAEPGTKEGQNKIVRNRNTAEVYMWSMSEYQWTKVGDVCEGTDGDTLGSDSKMVNGKPYHFAFDVELGDKGPKKKLGYNRGENPYVAAQRFIDDNDANQDDLEEIASFITKNVGPDTVYGASAPASDPLTGCGRYIPKAFANNDSTTPGGDPLTGGGRYIPKSSNNYSTPSAGDPLTGAGRYVPKAPVNGTPQAPSSVPRPPLVKKYIPHKLGPLFFHTSDQLEKIYVKIAAFNEALPDDKKMSSFELQQLKTSVITKLSSGSTSSFANMMLDSDYELIEKLLTWPTFMVFPAIDLARLAIAKADGSSYFFGKKSGAVIDRMVEFLSDPQSTLPIFILGCRFLCNMFSNRVAGSLANQQKERLLEAASNACKISDRRPREVYASLLLNYSVMLHDSKASMEDRELVLKYIVKALTHGERDEEVVFRLLVAMGTLMSGNDEFAAKSISQGVPEAATAGAGLSDRTRDCATEIAELITPK